MEKPSRNSKRANLSRKGILEAGFVEVRPGVFEKPGSSAHRPFHNEKPPAARVERNPAQRSEGKTRAESARERCHREGDKYQLVIISYRPRAIDHSNCCGKYIEDALINSGFIPDDSPFICCPPIIRQVIVPEKDQKTEVFLFKLVSQEKTHTGEAS